MIFGTLRLLIWLVGLIVVVSLGLSLVGYGIDWNYVNINRDACFNSVQTCEKAFIQKGLDGMQKSCHFDCFHPGSLIKQKTP